MRQAQVFISYRRDDAAGYARAIYDELARQFGPDRVFIDVDDIDAGQAFGDVIENAIGTAHVLLVLIGRRWHGERPGAASRISDPGDLVRREVAAGLAKGARVIPLLLDGTPMPSEGDLPEVLRPLAARNALEIDNTRFATDVGRLVNVVRQALGDAPIAAAPAPVPAKRARVIGAAIAAVIVVGAAVLAWQLRSAPSADGVASIGATSASLISGQWRADVSYDWPNAHYAERFVFDGDDGAVHGSASFLGVARGLLEGRLDANGLSFSTRSRETVGSGSDVEVVHRYRGRLVGDEIRFVMQTEGGSSTHVPVEFVARRSAPADRQP